MPRGNALRALARTGVKVKRMSYQVPTSAIPLLKDPPFVLMLLWLSVAIGYRTLRLLGAPVGEVSSLERGTLSAALGLGLLQFLPFLLAAVHVLSPRSVGLGLIALLALFARDMLRVARGVGRALRLAQPPPSAVWIGVGALILIPPLTVSLMQTLCPPTDIDGIGYHLTAPKRWLQAGGFFYLPTLPFTNSSMGVEMLYTLPMAVWSDTAAKLLHFTFGLLTLLALYALGRRFGSPSAGFAALVVYLIGIPKYAALPIFTWAYIDMALAFTSVCSFLAWTLWSRTRATGWLSCAALCAGFAATYKLSGFAVGVLLAGLTLSRLRQESVPTGRALRQSLRFLAITLLPVLPWLARSWALTGNPVYPFLANLFPTRDWDAAAGAAMTRLIKYTNWNWGAVGYRWSLATRARAIYIVMALTACLTALLIRREPDRERRHLIAFTGALTFLFVGAMGFYYRYLLPVLPCIYLLVFLELERVRRVSRWILPAVLLLALLNSIRVCRYHDSYAMPPADLAFSTALGRTSRADYLAERLDLMPMWDYVNASLPAGTRLLVAAFGPAFGPTSGAAYYCDHLTLATDAYHQRRIRLDTWEAYLASLRRDNIRFALIPDETVPNAQRDADLPLARNELPFAHRLAHEQGQPLLRVAHVVLYRLNI
jgi:hypothetical protein